MSHGPKDVICDSQQYNTMRYTSKLVADYEDIFLDSCAVALVMSFVFRIARRAFHQLDLSDHQSSEA